MNEREVSVRELIWKIVFGWRRMLVCVIIFVVLVTVLQYVSGQKNYNVALKEYEEQMAIFESEEGEKEQPVDMSAFTGDELQQINDVKSLQEMLDQSRTYMRNSILMNMNAYKEKVLILEYFVDSQYTVNYLEENRLDYTGEVVKAYTNYVHNGEIAKRIKDALKMEYELRYIEELIRTVENGKSFTIEIVYTDDMQSEDIARVAKEAVDEQTAGIAKQIGAHSLKLISENVMVKADTALANQQQTHQNIINNYRNQLNGLKNSMTDEQKEVLEIVVVSEESDEDDIVPEPVEPVKPGFDVKYLLLGLMAGIFVAAAWSACEMLFASRLQSAAELSDAYKLRMFGIIPGEKSLAGIDGFLVKMKKRHEKQMTAEEWLNMICANIELTCKDQRLQKIYFTGSEWEKLNTQIIADLEDRLKEAGVAVSCGGNICYDMKSLRVVHEIGTVILFEQEGISIYREIEREMKVLAEQNVSVLGCVGIE